MIIFRNPNLDENTSNEITKIYKDINNNIEIYDNNN